MQKLNREDLFSLESYHRRRSDFRRTVMAHKANRKLAIGPHTTLYFEDRLTIQYQVQEMLRVERIFEAEAIQEELDAYNPLIPEGGNWKATFMIEYEDAQERQSALEQMVGIEDRVWVQIGESERVWAVADEDLERTRETKTSAVHFLRFQFDDEMVRAAKAGAAIGIGIDHPAYTHIVQPLSGAIREALVADFA
jgi:Protein of unknown function (DUF3501)